MLHKHLSFALLLYFCLGAINLWGQKTLAGGYCPDFKGISYQSEYYKFFEDNSFLYILSDDTGIHYGKGKYECTKDSLLLHYSSLPEVMTTPQIISDSIEDSLCHIQIINTLDKNLNYELSYTIYEGDSAVARGQTHTFGYISFPLKAHQSATVSAHIAKDKNVFNTYFQIEIEGKNYAQNIVYTGTGLRLYKAAKGNSTVGFPIKFTSAGFKIKDYSGWNKFKSC